MNCQLILQELVCIHFKSVDGNRRARMETKSVQTTPFHASISWQTAFVDQFRDIGLGRASRERVLVRDKGKEATRKSFSEEVHRETDS